MKFRIIKKDLSSISKIEKLDIILNVKNRELDGAETESRLETPSYNFLMLNSSESEKIEILF